MPKRLFVYFLLAVLVVTAAAVPAPASAVDTGQEILFVVKNGVHFTSLTIEGKNQNGEFVSWSPSYIPDGGSSIAITDDWWWLGTVTLQFNLTSGESRTCLLDYVGAGEIIALVTYTPGQRMCTGDQGNSRSVGKRLVEAWISATMMMEEDTGIQLVDELNSAYDAHACLTALPQLAQSRLAVVRVPIACSGVAIDVLQNALNKVIVGK